MLTWRSYIRHVAQTDLLLVRGGTADCRKWRGGKAFSLARLHAITRRGFQYVLPPLAGAVLCFTVVSVGLLYSQRIAFLGSFARTLKTFSKLHQKLKQFMN